MLKVLSQLKRPLVATVAIGGLLVSSAGIASPLFSAFPDAELDKEELRHYIPYPIVTGLNNDEYKQIKVGGKLLRQSFELPRSYEPSHIINNYLAQVKALGGEVLFTCQLAACGNEKKLSKEIAPLNSLSKAVPALLTAKIQGKGKQVYVSIYAASWARATQFEISSVEVHDEPLDLLTVDTSYLGEVIKQQEFDDASEQDARDSADHPMISRLPGSYIRRYQQVGFGQTPVLVANGPEGHQVQLLEGKVTDIAYQLPLTYSEYEVNANYHASLLKLGFSPIYQCQGQECGRVSEMNREVKLLQANGSDKNQYYSLYRLERSEGDVYAMSYTVGTRNVVLSSELKIIEETKLNNERLVIDLEGLTDKIAETGHVALDGLLFEFDSDKMLPEAEEVIKLVAGYLKSHPKQSFYVAGHTDDQGKQTYNQALSERRAKAVVKRLVSQYQIPKSQITPSGLGEYSPVANNSNDKGKQLNRRVELVLRSDRL